MPSRKAIYSWTSGIISTVASGVVSAVGHVIIEPELLIYGEWRKLLLTAAVTAGIGLFNYLKQSPLPTYDDE